VPECNLTEKDIDQFLDEMTSYVEQFGSAFQRGEQLEWSKAHLRGLLGDAPGKNVERMALEQDENVRSMQHFMGQSAWKAEAVITIHQGLVTETLGEADGVALVDESGVMKQGDDSVEVKAVIVAQLACACVIRRNTHSTSTNWSLRSPKISGVQPPSKKARRQFNFPTFS